MGGGALFVDVTKSFKEGKDLLSIQKTLCNEKVLNNYSREANLQERCGLVHGRP